MDRNKDQVDLSLRDLESKSKASSAVAAASQVGTILMGQVVTAANALVRVHVGRRAYGQVALTDMHDGFVDNPSTGITKDMYVRCCVVGKIQGQEGNQLHLSLQKSNGGSWQGQGSAQQSPNCASVTAVSSAKQLKEGQQVIFWLAAGMWACESVTYPAPQIKSCILCAYSVLPFAKPVLS